MRRFAPVLVIALLAGCGVVSRTHTPPTPPPDLNERLAAFLAVCRGTGIPAAPDYTKHDDHRAVLAEGKGDDMQLAPERLPEDWTVQLPSAEGIEDVDVVVCGERVAAKAVRLCQDMSGQKNAIKWHTATYSYTARSARTGKALGKPKMLEARSHRCPTNVSVGADYMPLDQFARIPKSTVQDFVKPYLDD